MPAGYFCKVMISLLARRPAEMLTIIKEHKVVPMLLDHLGASSILDLLLKAVQEAEIMSTQRNSSFGQVMQSEDMLSFGRTESRSSSEAVRSILTRTACVSVLELACPPTRWIIVIRPCAIDPSFSDT